MPIDKATRKARHENALSPAVKVTGFPSPREGGEGDVAFREIKGGVKQLVKKGGKWKEVS
jgi:hypothetical protein